MELTVIVPVYNGEKTIGKCVLSLINQDYEDMEILIVNDGSTDSTLDIVNGLVKAYPDKSIRIINKENQGLPQARKTGINNSESEYIGFLDADDWVESNMYSSMMKYANKNNADVVSCDVIFDYPKKTEYHHQRSKDKIISGKKALKYCNDRIAVFQYCCNKIIRRSLFDSVWFPTGNPVGEDYFIIHQVLPRADIVCILNESLHHYVQFKTSMTRGGFTVPKKSAFRYYKKTLKEVYEKKNRNLIISTENYIINDLLWICISMVENNTFDYKFIDFTKKLIKHNLYYLLKNKNNSFLYKASTILFIISCKALGITFLFYDKLLNRF